MTTNRHSDNRLSDLKKVTNLIIDIKITSLFLPNLNSSSEAIINYKPLGFYNSTDFSEIFFYFTEKITNIIPNNKFTSFLFEFADTFIKRPNCNSIPDTTFLSKQTQGFLRIFYTLKNIPKLANFDNDKYTLSGIYISPYAKSILEKKNLLAV